MTKRMLIDALHAEETRVAIADENQIYDFDFVSTAKKQLKGNIYLAKITRVEPSLQAAFVEYGGGKQGFLPFAEIHADYYQIPTADRKRLMEEAAREINDENENQPESNPAPEFATESEQPEISAAPTHEGPLANPSSEEYNSAMDYAVAVNQYDIPTATESVEDEAERPAYLTHGAIDISTSEEVPEDHTPISELPVEQSEQPAGEAQEPQASANENPQAETVETLQNEEEEVRSRKKNNFSKRYKIQEVIRRGQIVLVQVIKEERGNKGCSLTTYLSLAGRYCVLMPNSPKDGGISRKIASGDDRKRLKAISTELRLADGMSVIIRTAGMDRTRAEIKRDYDYLVKLWNQIREDTLKSNAPALIYEESDIIKRAIRDQYTSDIDELIIEGDEGFNQAKEFMKLLLPSHTAKIQHYKEPTPLFYAYGIEEQLLSMHDPVVKLRSGGYIVINPTEALISIDVNSGRATGERNIEETASKTNLEAAAEIGRQLRLRDLAGLIVVDFIDMLESRNRRAVEKAMKDALKADRAKIQLGRISPFGLLEMSRQRLRPSIAESNMVQCPHCIGRGVIRSNESMSIQMIRSIEKEASAGSWSGLRLIAPQGVALHLLNNKRDILRAIEQRYNLTVQILIGPELTSSEFNLEKMRRGGGQPERESSNDRDFRRDRNRRPERDRSRDERPRQPEPASEQAGNDNIEMVETDTPETSDRNRNDRNRRGGRNNRRGGRNNRPDRDRNNRPPVMDTDQPVAENIVLIDTPSENAAPVEGEQPASSRPPRTRGGRGRRKWRDRDERGPRNETAPAAETADAPTSWRSDEPAIPAGKKLPAFATEERLPPPPPPEPKVIPLESTPRDPSAQPKKGWWKKMIELDE